jgi:hypothetical protein
MRADVDATTGVRATFCGGTTQNVSLSLAAASLHLLGQPGIGHGVKRRFETRLATGWLGLTA